MACLSGNARRDHTAAQLILFYRFKQRTEVALAKAFIALPLDELEEDRADDGAREDLQQHLGLAAADDALAIDQDAELLQAVDRLAMAGQPLVELLVIGRRRRGHEAQPVGTEFGDRLIDIVAAAGDVLNALALVALEVLLDLAAIVGAFIDGDANLAARACHGARMKAGMLARNIEEADLAEVEELLVPIGPPIHPTPEYVVGEMIDVVEPGALR